MAGCKRYFLLIFVGIIFCSAIDTFAQVPKWKELEAKGDTLYKEKDFKGAIRFYTKAIDLNKFQDKQLYSTLYKRSVSYFNTSEFTLALKDLDIFIPEYPRVSQAKLLKAFIYREMGDDEMQLSNLESAMENQQPDPELLKWRGMLYLQKDDYQKTKSDMLLARQLEDDSEIETYLGLSYYNLEQRDSAFMSFNKSIELDATYLPAYLYAGSISLEDGNNSLALQYMNLALRVDTKNKEALFYKGVALIELKRTDEGCSCLNRAFYMGMDDASGYLTEYCYEVEN
ncbi:hypothetical protein BH09BAC3_BH09BAC3_15880 [soil metagenome]